MSTIKAPSMSLLRAFSGSTCLNHTTPWIARGCLFQQRLRQQTAAFSASEILQARNKGRDKKDSRITLIRYHLQHPLTPRPLHFSRTRALRHWTIHRAWQLYQAKLKRARQVELERQYLTMSAACEALRLIDNDGLTAVERERIDGGESQGGGRLYRTAMMKDGIWNGVPIEYARIQTDSPPRDGWSHGWTR